MDKTKTKQNKSLWCKLVIAALIIVLAATVVLLPRQIGTASAASADAATFVSVRSGVKNIPNDSRTFASYDFQRNENKFYHIEASDIAGLNDNRHNKTLKQQSEAIRQSDSISTVPILTVLTPGQGGAASDWSNDGNPSNFNKTYNLAYDSTSMIETLRVKGDANVYVARSNIFTDIKNSKAGDFYKNTSFVSLIKDTGGNRPLMSLFPLEKNNYSTVNNLLRESHTLDDSGRRTHIRDYYKHNILVFESRDPYQYRNFVYNELNSILTMISYDYYVETGVVPLINMIGFSAGGVWNMMWANQHPHNVHSMFSLGATFNGSDLATHARVGWTRDNRTFPDLLGDIANNPSSFDNTDEWQRDILMADWQNAVIQNPKLKLFTYAAETNYSLLLALPPWWGYAIIAVIVSVGIVPPAFALAAATLVAIYGWELLWYFFDSTSFSLSDGFVLSDDVTTSVSSASAVGFYNPNSNINTTTDVFTAGNSNSTKLARGDLAVTHNRLSRDTKSISHVESKISMGKLINVTLQGNNATIIGVNANLYREFKIPDSVVIENVVYAVTAIGPSAFANQTQYFEIFIPASVTNIGDRAFQGCTQLINVTFAAGSNLKTIGDYAFKDCLILGLFYMHDFALPNNLETIGRSAFEGAFILNVSNYVELVISSSVTSIGENAFKNSTKLSLIWNYSPNFKPNKNSGFATYLKSINVPGGTTAVTIPDGVETITANLLQNRAGLNSVIIPASVTKIEAGAFDGSGMFSNSSNILGDIVYAGSGTTRWAIRFNSSINYDLTSANPVGIADGVFGSYFTDIIIPSSLKYTGNNTFPTNEKLSVTWHYNSNRTAAELGIASVLTNVVIPGGTTAISAEAFKGCVKLNNIIVPSSVTTIGSSAFSGSTNLREVYVKRTASQGISSLGTNAFLNTPIGNNNSDARIFVTSGSENTYKNDSRWGQYKSRIFTVSSTWNGTTATAYAGGGGWSSLDPFQISTGEQLARMASQINSGSGTTSYYILTNDIFLNDTTGWQNWSSTNRPLNIWTPIGNYTQPFKGTFDGRGFVVRGIYTNGVSNQGLFGLVDSGTIRNVGVAQSNICGGGGGIAGTIQYNSTIINCYNSGTVGSSGVGNAGGIAGSVTFSSRIFNCYNTGTIGSSSSYNAGGIAGSIQFVGTTIVNNYSSGTVNAYNRDSIGGIVGQADNFSRVEFNYFLRTSSISKTVGIGAYSVQGIDNNFSFNAAGNLQAAYVLFYPTVTFGGNLLDALNGALDNPTASGISATLKARRWAGSPMPAHEPLIIVNFDSQGGSAAAPISVAYGFSYEHYCYLTTPTKAGYYFRGWWTASNGGGSKITYNSIVNISQNHTLYAKWEEHKYVTVIFKDDDTTLYVGEKIVELAYGASGGSLPTPTKTGHIFAGWWTTKQGAGTQITNSTTVTDLNTHNIYARWTLVDYTLKFDLNGGSGNFPEETIKYGSILDKTKYANPTKAGYILSYWALSTNLNNEYNWDAPVTGNITLVAIWQVGSQITHTVTFQPDNNTSSFTNTVHHGTLVTIPQNPIRTGYKFMYWSLAGQTTEYNFNTPVTQDITLQAKWAPVYTIIYMDLGGGFSGAFGLGTPFTHAYGTDTQLVAPTRNGYIFAGWFKNSDGTDQVTSLSGTQYTADITLYAGWIPVYTITYMNLDGEFKGTFGLGTPFTHVYGTDTQLVAPTRMGYIFAGWFKNSDGTDQVTSLSGTQYTADIMLYAGWTKDLQYVLNEDSTETFTSLKLGPVVIQYVASSYGTHSIVSSVGAFLELYDYDGNIIATGVGSLTVYDLAPDEYMIVVTSRMVMFELTLTSLVL